MKKIVILFIISSIYSCKKINCEAIKQRVKENECMIIVEKLPNSPYFKAKGKDLNTKKESECFDGERWWTQYAKYIEIGDTLVKKKGELIFSIHKKDTILSFPWECKNGVLK